MRKVLIFPVIMLLVGSFSCTKNSELAACRTSPYLVPNSLFFGIKKNGVRITDDVTLDHLKIS